MQESLFVSCNLLHADKGLGAVCGLVEMSQEYRQETIEIKGLWGTVWQCPAPNSLTPTTGAR